MPPARGEGMTGSPIRLPCAGKPSLKTTTTHRPNKPESSTSLVDLPALNSIRRTASRPARTRKLAERTKTTQPLVLTGPSPSGMTWGVPGCLTAIPRDLSHGLLHFLRLEIPLCTTVHTDTRYGLP